MKRQDPVQPPATARTPVVADESMVRNLAAQAMAVWPQEMRLFRRYNLPAGAQILDVACGMGEITSRLAELFPGAQLRGVDIFATHVERARQRYAREPFADRLQFEAGDAYALNVARHSQDLTVCRHLLQAIPYPEGVIGELKRVTRPGGWAHVLAEDYGMIHFHPTRLDPDPFWRQIISLLGSATQTDLRVGRRAYTLMREAGFRNVRVDYITVDTIRVSREICASIIEAWRDGYSETLAERTQLSLGEVLAHFDDMIACIRHPRGYAVWQVPIIAGQA